MVLCLARADVKNAGLGLRLALDCLLWDNILTHAVLFSPKLYLHFQQTM